MRPGFELELALRAETPHLDIGLRVRARGHGLVRHVRNAGEPLAKLLVHRFHLLVERRDALTHGANIGLHGGRVLACLFELADLLRLRVALCLELFGLGDEPSNSRNPSTSSVIPRSPKRLAIASRLARNKFRSCMIP